ncbi:MAG: glycoside hydrolase family 3 C-terminal domain-containing protein [Acidobacteria bacterium]|nr:glycoside hydrolase family 3 C-terminal domain-containing protein [Acidobacteriota bacterium]
MPTTIRRLPHRLRCAYLSLFLIVSPVVALAAGPQPQQKLSPAEIDRRVDAMLAKLTLAQKIKLIGGVDGMFTHAMPEIGLPRLKMSDGPMGVRTWGPDTAYAAGIGLAASWDVKLARQIGVSLGHDARARGVNFILGPGINIYRAPMGGRNFEFFGEDPYLAGQIAAHYILGVQSQDVVATVKHFDANNSEYDRHRSNSIIDERTLREIYLPAFEAAVKEGHVGAVMASYNLINGEHATQNKFLDTDVLKKDWGFRGILMSDWGATHNGIAAANAGLDLEMPSAEYMNAQTLLPAIKAGKVSVATINDKVRRILRVALEFGFFNHVQQDLSIPLYDQQSLAVALRSAEESMVLLKNEGNLLPLTMSQIHTIAVIGPNAYPAVACAGGSAHVTAFAPISFMTGLSDSLAPGTKVLWNSGIKTVEEIFSSSNFATDQQGREPGLQQEEFPNADFSGEPSSVFRVFHLNSESFSSPPPGRVVRSVRWSGYYIPKTSGPQRFFAAVGPWDSYRLYVNNKLVLNVPPNFGIAPRAADVDLTAGQPASVRLDYVLAPTSNRLQARLGVIPVQEMLEPDVRKIASLADVVVLSVGFNDKTEGEGFDRSYHLPPGQEELIKAVVAANPRTIVVLTAGGSVATRGWLDRVPVLIQSWYAGSKAGRALAEVLTGKVDPSGKLPMTWWQTVQEDPTYKNYYEIPGTHDVKYREGVFLGYRAYGRPGQAPPLFPFGYGLSYTRFAFSNLSVTPEEASPNGPITVSFDVQNVGQRAGAEVAQVYVGDPSATVPMPQKQLKGFDRVMLAPGQSQRVTVTLDRRSLAYWSDKANGWKVDPGKFIIYVGDSSEHVPLQAGITVR